jgi:hypothetical protein
MAGLTDAQIMQRRTELISLIKNWFKDDDIEIIDSFTKSEEIKGRGRIAMLGDSIALMRDAEMVIFAKGWEKSPGCNVEHEVCVQYKIRRMYETVMENENKPPKMKNEDTSEKHIFWR